MKTHIRICLLLITLLCAPTGCAAGEDFAEFLQKFTTSARFQYSRVKFPLKTPITLLKEDGETEQSFPFTRDKWPLLDAASLQTGRMTDEEGGVYVAQFTTNQDTRKEFEAGYEESEPSLRISFTLIGGEWYVTDCYNDWFNADLIVSDLPETLKEITAENEAFQEQWP